MNPEYDPRSHAVPLWQPVVYSAFGGGLAWGIRGQYGHETGAMIAGLLIGLVLTLLFRPHANSLSAARAVAFCTVAIGFGGSTTYAQSIGLTQNIAFIGNWTALSWGMVGLALKGGIWIGFGAVFLGMGLGGVRYRAREILLIMVGLLLLYMLGVWVFNTPFDPSRKAFPPIFFSYGGRWSPGSDERPRYEDWGGLLFSLIGLIAYTKWVRRDPLAPRLGLWGILGGMVGFPLGQCLQAFHAWNPQIFSSGIWAQIDKNINWWNFMETSFGAVMGATMGLGLWLNRRRIASLAEEPETSLSPLLEGILAALYVSLLVTSEFTKTPGMEWFNEYSLVLGMIPLFAAAGGRWWPYLLTLPMTALPIAGKTLRQLAYREHSIEVVPGWLVYIVVPLSLATILSLILARGALQNRQARPFLRWGLLFSTWLYFVLNLAFFHYPWPWDKWTFRTANTIVFAVFALGLTALVARSKTSPGESVR